MFICFFLLRDKRWFIFLYTANNHRHRHRYRLLLGFALNNTDTACCAVKSSSTVGDTSPSRFPILSGWTRRSTSRYRLLNSLASIAHCFSEEKSGQCRGRSVCTVEMSSRKDLFLAQRFTRVSTSLQIRSASFFSFSGEQRLRRRMNPGGEELRDLRFPSKSLLFLLISSSQ